MPHKAITLSFAALRISVSQIKEVQWDKKAYNIMKPVIMLLLLLGSGRIRRKHPCFPHVASDEWEM
jgi:hypothetical protein